jgi:uncharacterized protein YndB with AHSA1/START domain
MSASSQVAQRAQVTMPSDREIRTEREFNASRDAVWRAYSEIDLLRQWWGRGNRLTVERFEFERGGHWRFVEHSEDGEHGFEGRFREISPKDRIVMTFEWDGMPGHVIIETVEFHDVGGNRTRIVTNSLFHTTWERDGMVQAGMEGGLNESYAALDRLLETLK